jgi:tRNA (Thr-GGU) A37 N-methylase
MEAESEALIVAPAQAVNWLEHVANDTRRLVQSLPSYTDEELLVCRQSAEVLNEASWIVICATDHEIMRRAQPVRNRQEGDLTKSGIYATAVGRPRRLAWTQPRLFETLQFSATSASLTNKEDPMPFD